MCSFKFFFIRLSCLSLALSMFTACEQHARQLSDDFIEHTREAPSPAQLQQGVQQSSKYTRLFADYDSHLVQYDSSIYFLDWSYDPTTNNITWNKKERMAVLEAFNHRLGLGFDQHVAKENQKSMRYTAISPFANLEATGMYDRQKPLLLNGKPFSGVLVGTHTQTGERLIEARFYKGIRIGTFKVWSNVGRLHQRDFGRNNIILLDEAAVRKPVIYLYPKQLQTIQVALDFKGHLTHSYPQYPPNGWQVQAQPDGTLTDVHTGKEYGYLFWEGESLYHYQAQTGFVVAGAATADFLDEKLALLGLNRAEATDFISYWLPELERNPYNFIHFAEADYQAQARLTILPKPETLLRIFMVYQPLATPVVIPEQRLLPAQRQGFTVVEWGGKQEQQLLVTQ